MSSLPNGIRSGVRAADTDSLYDILALVLDQAAKRGESISFTSGDMPQVAGQRGRVVYVRETNSWQRLPTQ